MRSPMVVRWPGHIKPGTIKNDILRHSTGCPHLLTSPVVPRPTSSRHRSKRVHIPASLRRRSMASISATTSKASQKSRRAIPSSTIRGRIRPRSATRTGRCTSPWCRTIRRASLWV
jgi:hypothetical protein